METKRNPAISIIIPTYNEEKFLNAALSSIFSQKTDFSYEVIVVDNLSHDKTAEIASRWDVTFASESKPGAAVTRNTGAAHAHAPILYFLDADCRIPQGGLEKIMNVFNDNPNVDVVSGPYIYDLDGFFPLLFTDTFHYFSWFHAVIRFFYGVSQFPGGNFAIKKQQFDTVRGFDPTMCNQEIILPDDLDLAIRLNKIKTNTVFSRNYSVFSSFRRVKRSPIRHTLVRFFATLKLLGRKSP